jgi:hypothetical protein
MHLWIPVDIGCLTERIHRLAVLACLNRMMPIWFQTIALLESVLRSVWNIVNTSSN